MGTHNLTEINGISSPQQCGGVKQERPMKLEGVPTNILAVSYFSFQTTLSIDLKKILSTHKIKRSKIKNYFIEEYPHF